MKRAKLVNILILLLSIYAVRVTCSLPAEPKFYIELPQEFMQKLETDTEGTKKLWHPRLTIHKVENRHGSAQAKNINNKEAGFLSFMATGAQASNVLLMPGASGNQILDASKMNCQCRFIKDPSAGTPVELIQMPTQHTQSPAPVSLIQEPVAEDNDIRIVKNFQPTVMLQEGEKVHKKKQQTQDDEVNDEITDEDLITLLKQTRDRLDDLENEKNSDDDLKSQMKALLQDMKEEDESDDLAAIRAMLLEEKFASETSEDDYDKANEKSIDYEDFAKFMEMYHKYEEFQAGLVQNKKSKKKTGKKDSAVLAQLAAALQSNDDDEYDDEDLKLLMKIKSMNNKKSMNRMLKELLSS